MTRSWRHAVGLSLCAAALVASACGDDGGGSATYTVVPPSLAAAGNVTPFPTPLLEGNKVSSSPKGYSATLPDGWTMRANLVQTRDASVDAFFEPLAPGAKAQANISVNCVVVKAREPQEWTDSIKTNTVRQQLNKDIQTSQRMISGINATVITYTNTTQQTNQQNLRLDKQDIVFSNDKCDWMITTLTLAGDREKYQPLFDIFLNSFKLLP